MPTGYRRDVLALLRQPRWLGLAALTVGMCVLFWWLGTWQFGRHLERSEQNAAIERAQNADPAELDSLVPIPTDPPVTAAYRSATATGTYLADRQVLQRNPRGRSGYAVITPLALEDGGTLLVDRGWVARITHGRQHSGDRRHAPGTSRHCHGATSRGVALVGSTGARRTDLRHRSRGRYERGPPPTRLRGSTVS